MFLIKIIELWTAQKKVTQVASDVFEHPSIAHNIIITLKAIADLRGSHRKKYVSKNGTTIVAHFTPITFTPASIHPHDARRMIPT